MKKSSISIKEFYIKKAIQIAQLKEKKLESYSNQELKQVGDAFSTPRMQELKNKFGETDFIAAMNLLEDQGYLTAQSILEEETEEVPLEDQEVIIEEEEN